MSRGKEKKGTPPKPCDVHHHALLVLTCRPESTRKKFHRFVDRTSPFAWQKNILLLILEGCGLAKFQPLRNPPNNWCINTLLVVSRGNLVNMPVSWNVWTLLPSVPSSLSPCKLQLRGIGTSDKNDASPRVGASRCRRSETKASPNRNLFWM